MVEKFIDDFIREIPDPNRFVFSLILANAFDGTVFVKNMEDGTIIDYVVLIKDVLYDVYGVVSFVDIDIENYVPLDKYAPIVTADLYHKVKWFFINEINDDEQYHRDMC